MSLNLKNTAKALLVILFTIGVFSFSLNFSLAQGLPNSGNTGSPVDENSSRFSISNPIGNDTLLGLIETIAGWILTLAIPVSVIMIVYAGYTYLTSGGAPAKVQKAKQTLTYAIIGLAIIMIGRGFVSLIQSILDLRN